MIVFVDLSYKLTCSVPGHTMSNLAGTYSDLGRHKDALVLQEKTLAMLQRVLPDNHPDIGVCDMTVVAGVT